MTTIFFYRGEPLPFISNGFPGCFHAASCGQGRKKRQSAHTGYLQGDWVIRKKKNIPGNTTTWTSCSASGPRRNTGRCKRESMRRVGSTRNSGNEKSGFSHRKAFSRLLVIINRLLKPAPIQQNTLPLLQILL